MLLTLSSGVKGLTTIHAGSARQALSRLRFLCQLSDSARDLPMPALNSLVAEAVDIVVHCTRRASAYRSRRSPRSKTCKRARRGCVHVSELFRRPRPTETLVWSGVVPVRAGRAFAAAGFDVRSLLEYES